MQILETPVTRTVILTNGGRVEYETTPNSPSLQPTIRHSRRHFHLRKSEIDLRIQILVLKPTRPIIGASQPALSYLTVWKRCSRVIKPSHTTALKGLVYAPVLLVLPRNQGEL